MAGAAAAADARARRRGDIRVEPDGTKYVALLRALEEFRGQARLVPDGPLALIDAREIAT